MNEHTSHSDKPTITSFFIQTKCKEKVRMCVSVTSFSTDLPNLPYNVYYITSHKSKNKEEKEKEK
jgi:hypothetical protein